MARAYAQSFAGLTAGGIPTLVAGLPPGGRLLDVGCGTGALVRAARDGGTEAVAVDLDPDMAALAASRLGTDVTVAGLPDLPFADDGFDTVVASFVLNHVEDPRSGSRELVRVAAPGGSVRATVWTSAPTVHGALFREVMEASGAVEPVIPRLPEHLDFERSLDGLGQLFAAAGAPVVEARMVDWDWRVSPDDFWAGVTGGVGNTGVVWAAQDPDTQVRMREELDRLAAPLLEDGVLVFGASAAYVEARVPRS
ncbi:Ubiquinone/menaquinone biosynthesis C-methylase UbiE [Nocardioides alpinus]|uniref:Ubiquinone/menaquinone biosynthesis C-methylase UbiE n=1 Tax=Nocardioides alpinus TaxID=748909 RepID=A0A1I1AU40_9ACTN|nr:Ubiquinone/menaquinone biosynthesis C-methylase UbiE [Nocardioides alpinus]